MFKVYTMIEILEASSVCSETMSLSGPRMSSRDSSVSARTHLEKATALKQSQTGLFFRTNIP